MELAALRKEYKSIADKAADVYDEVITKHMMSSSVRTQKKLVLPTLAPYWSSQTLVQRCFRLLTTVKNTERRVRLIRAHVHADFFRPVLMTITTPKVYI